MSGVRSRLSDGFSMDAVKFSKSAVEKIQAAGGEARITR